MSIPQAQAQPIQTVNSQIPNAVAEVVDNTSQGVSSITSNVSDNVNSATDYVKDSISSFSDSDLVGSTTSFLESNTLIAKFAFLIFVLIIFMILLNLGVKIIGYFMKPKGDPKLINGTMNASNEVTRYQDPKNADAVPILRSNNQNKGIEFTWSLWIYINDISKSQKYSHVFNKGNSSFTDDGMATVNNAPGLYIENETNNLIIAMNTVAVSNQQEMLTVKNIPLRKWFNCIIRIENTALDVYINGGIVARTVLQDVPKQNYQNVNVCKNGGFNGNMADLQYYDKALSIFQINNIVSWGRNTRSANENSTNDATGFPYYLSNLWYSSNY
jgi:hypothetical protein